MEPSKYLTELNPEQRDKLERCLHSTPNCRTSTLKCPRLPYQSQCEFSVDFWFQRG
jgi:hypothetical protein